MYTAFHSLQKKPFSMTADPSFLFVTRQHREALMGLTYAVLDRKGVLVLSGMAGSGKTTLLSWVLERLSCDNLRSSVILNPTLTSDEFLELMMLDFGMTDIPASKAQRLWRLQAFLVAGVKDRKVNVLVVDEAHKLSYQLLEEIRLLGNLECGEEKLLQILLLGQNELDDILNRPELWQFKQRISVRLAIGGLAPNEVEPYIQHRWTIAGGQAHPFTPEAVEQIRKYSKGVPRLINAICDNALTEAFADESRSVTRAHIDAAAQHLLLVEKPKIATALPAPAPVSHAAAPAVPAAPAAATVSPSQVTVKPWVPRSIAAAPAAKPNIMAIVPRPAAPPTNGTHAAASLEMIKTGTPGPARRSALSRWAARLGWNGRH